MTRAARAAFTTAVACMACSWVVDAHAQANVALIEVDRDRGEDLRGPPHNWTINYADCIDENDFYFRFRLEGEWQGLSLEVWVSDQTCENYDDREKTGHACQQVVEPISVKDTPLLVTVSVRRIVAGLVGESAANVVDDGQSGAGSNDGGAGAPTDVGSSGDGGAGGTTGAAGAGGAEAAADAGEVSAGGAISEEARQACNYQGPDDPQPYTLSFLLVNNQGKVQGTFASMSDQYDLKGPAPPTDITTQPIEQGLKLAWTRSESTDQAGYQFYCVEATDAGGENGQACEPKEDSFPGADFDRGRVESELAVDGFIRTQFSKEGTPRLENDVLYAVSIAGFDDFDNTGEPSGEPYACGTPKEVDEFFELYRKNGGRGGGGFCALARPSVPTPPYLLALVLASTLGCAARRRFRRRAP